MCKKAFIYGIGFFSSVAFAQLDSGPMVGHTTHNRASIWALDHGAKNLKFSLLEENGLTNETTAAAGIHDVFRHQFTDLKPATKYRYQITTPSGEVVAGGFTTAPEPDKPTRFTYAVTSCMDAKRFPEQIAWDLALEKDPDFHLLVGDNVYADSTRFDVLLEHHLKQRAVPNFARFIATRPNYAVWDDHDYGPNDSHGATPGKEDSLKAFKTLWANPSYGLPETPGVFHTFKRGDVEFFMLDGRYYRTDERAPKTPGKTQFGEAQLDWLFDSLRKSKATFKVIVKGYDIMSTRYPDETKKIAGRIRKEGISGIFFHSGDIHRNEFKQQDHGMGYPMTQITSSGIARNPVRPWTLIQIDTTVQDPTVTAEFYVEEKLVETHLVRLSELTIKSD